MIRDLTAGVRVDGKISVLLCSAPARQCSRMRTIGSVAGRFDRLLRPAAMTRSSRVPSSGGNDDPERMHPLRDVYACGAPRATEVFQFQVIARSSAALRTAAALRFIRLDATQSAAMC